jgi:predicted NBD/HSP70 family sugar kinase
MQLLGGGLAVPGLVDDATSKVFSAPNVGWENVVLDLAALLPDTPLGVRLFNEANAGALAEVRHRPPGGDDFLFVSGEVGVGGGLLIGSELFTGPEGHAGEVGHMVVVLDGVLCSCGGRGYLETVAGQDAIFAAAGICAPDSAETAIDARSTAGRTSNSQSLSESMTRLKTALLEGDPAAVEAVARAGRYLGVAVASTVRLLNIYSVVLGGHFAILSQWIMPALRDSLGTYAPGKVAPGNISLSAVGQSGALRGAASSVVRHLLDWPHQLLK